MVYSGSMPGSNISPDIKVGIKVVRTIARLTQWSLKVYQWRNYRQGKSVEKL